MKKKKILKIFSALSQETRLEIYRLLIQEGPDGLAAGVIAEIFNVPSATLSFHLSHLADAGLILSVKKGRSIIYSANYKIPKKIARYLTDNSYIKQQKNNVSL